MNDTYPFCKRFKVCGIIEFHSFWELILVKGEEYILRWRKYEVSNKTCHPHKGGLIMKYIFLPSSKIKITEQNKKKTTQYIGV